MTTPPYNFPGGLSGSVSPKGPAASVAVPVDLCAASAIVGGMPTSVSPKGGCNEATPAPVIVRMGGHRAPEPQVRY